MDVTFSGFFHVLVTVLFSVVTLGLAISFAVHPAEKKLRILRGMSSATLFSIMAGIAAGIGATALHSSLAPAGGQTEVAGQTARGLAEAMVPAVLGFVSLALSWMLASVGLRRQG